MTDPANTFLNFLSSSPWTEVTTTARFEKHLESETENNTLTMKCQAFEGYKWQDHTYEGGRFPKVLPFLAGIKWEVLCDYASSLNNNEPCKLDPQIAMRGRNVVRILNFPKNTQWVARLRMPPIDEEASFLLQREVNCMKLVTELTNVPVPTIYGYNASAELIGAPFILMECLKGNAAMNLNDGLIPAEHKSSFYNSLARHQVEFSSVTLPKIGSVIRNPDGTYDVGPLHELGGPFSTATEYLEAWAEHAKFHGGTDDVIERCGDLGEGVLQGVLAFPRRVSEATGRIALHNDGPFPLVHPDLWHSNIIVDDNWKTLGVIDWEYAQSAPWETIEFPPMLGLTPQPMAAPWFYDENGVATDENIISSIKEREGYLNMIKQFERSEGILPLLSDVLGDQAGQDLASAMTLFTEVGKHGLYNKVFDVHKERWESKPGDC